MHSGSGNWPFPSFLLLPFMCLTPLILFSLRLLFPGPKTPIQLLVLCGSYFPDLCTFLLLCQIP